MDLSEKAKSGIILKILSCAAEEIVFLSTGMEKAVDKTVIGDDQEFNFGNTDFWIVYWTSK